MRALIVAAAVAGCTETSLVYSDGPPDAAILAPTDGERVIAGRTVALLGSASDPEDAPTELQAQWFVDGFSACPPRSVDADGQTRCETTLEPGQHPLATGRFCVF